MNSIVDLLSDNAGLGEPGREYGGFVLGAVTDNGNKEQAGMVQVEFTAWKSGKNITQWIPLLRPYAGKEHGVYLVPEVGDTVLVGFIGSDMKQPFVLGSFFPADASLPKDCFVDKNTTRSLKTKGGIMATLSDEKGKEAISVTTPGGLSLALEDEKQLVSLSDKDGKNKMLIDCKGGALQLEADSKITLKTGKCELVMDGKSGQLSVSGGQLQLKAQQKAELDGGQMLDVKGGMVKVEGKQSTAVKGAIVQLN